MASNLNSTINISNIINNASNSSTFFRNADTNGSLQNCLNVGATGIYNYVPYVPTGNPTTLSQIGGTIFSSNSSTSNANTTPAVLTNMTLSPGTYVLNAHFRIFNSASNIQPPSFIWFGFNTVSATFSNNPDIYALMELEYNSPVNYIITGTSGELNRRLCITVNFTTTTTIYLNYQITSSGGSNTLEWDMSATRLA